MRAIYLTGFMGAGKTTVGKSLAAHLKLKMIDTDAFIEEQTGKSIRDIFEQEGESTFRHYERHYLRALPVDNVIITTGGGMVMQKENRDWMRENGTVIYLHCSPDKILGRLKEDTSRPLLDANKEVLIQQLLKERLPFYKEANYTVDTSEKSIVEVVAEINTLIRKEETGRC